MPWGSHTPTTLSPFRLLTDYLFFLMHFGFVLSLFVSVCLSVCLFVGSVLFLCYESFEKTI